MKITFWGTRGSISVPDPDYMKYGGDTSCVEVRLEDNTCFIFDSGTGIRNCGNRLIESPPKDNKINLILSHTHWDHIQGFPFFAPVFNPIFEIEMMGLFKQDGRLHDTLSGQMDERYFPVNLSDLPSRLKFRELIEESFQTDGAKITSRYVTHPQGCLGYRMEAEGNVVTYLTDCEFGPDDDISKPMELAKDADYFIFDSQYTDEEYKNRLGWGHSPWTTGVKIAKKAGVKTLVLFHHDPYHNDKFMDSMLEEVREQFPNTIAATRCLELELKPSRKKNKIKEKINLSVNEFFEFEGNCFSDPKNNKLVVFCPQNMVEKNCREFFKKAGQNFQDSIHKIEIYFDRCPQMGSQALGNFVKFIALAKTAKKEVYVGGLSKALKQTFRISHVDQLVKSLD